MTITSKKLKTVISLLAVVIVLSSIAMVPVNAAYTPYWQKARALVAAALTAINIVAESATMNVASVVEYIADPMEVQYSYVDMWEDRPEIQIYPDYVTIDGRDYTDIWISNEAAEKFRVNAFDFKTAYSIASNSNGTFASGVGNYQGIPMYNVNNHIISQGLNVGYPFPDNSTLYDWGTNSKFEAYKQSGVSVGKYVYPNNTKSSYVPYYSSYRYPRIEKNNNGCYLCSSLADGTIGDRALLTNYYVASPFSYDYTSGLIPADESLPSDIGMLIRVPSDDGNGNRYFDTWLHDNPEFDQGEPVTIDVQLDPTIETKLDDLLDIIIPIIPLINNNFGDVTFVENHETPTPPVPDTLLPDTYWSQLETKLDQIRQTIQNLNPDFSQIIQSISTIPQAITQAVSNITQSLSNLGDRILQDIEEGPIRLLDKLIDVLRTLFFPILATLRGFLGIWHYVVTWMSNISAPFAWIMGLMAGASPILVSPIYALIAGIIVIAVYRRFGR